MIKNKRERYSSIKGITLIAMVITIIVLLILAGVAIVSLMGDNGIVNKSQQAQQTYREAQAREKLEIVLFDMQADKVTNPNYNGNEYLTNEITKSSMIVDGDIVIVDGWKFEIDRSIPKIANSLGKENENESIVLVANSNIDSDYASSTIQVTITYSGIIESILIGEENIQVPAPVNGVYTVSKKVIDNGNYRVLVKDENGGYKTALVEVTGITEDINIGSKEELEAFRDKVNNGATFIGKTIRLMSDIDLQGSESNLWIPIGNYGDNINLLFKGTFEGNKHTISNIYINTEKNYQGLFGYNDGNIREVTVTGTITGSNSSMYIGGIAGTNGKSGRIKKCFNQCSVNAYTAVGGIIGANFGKIEESGNTGEIQARYSGAGGIAGTGDDKESTIQKCFNSGYIHANLTTGGICGYKLGGNIYNCYNIGKVSSTNMAGGINGAAGIARTTQRIHL